MLSPIFKHYENKNTFWKIEMPCVGQITQRRFKSKSAVRNIYSTIRKYTGLYAICQLIIWKMKIINF